MTEKDGKAVKPVSKRGRPAGAKNRPKAFVPLTRRRVMELMAKCYTPAQQEKLFKALKPGEVFKLLGPKGREAAAVPSVRLIISGLPGECPHCGGIVHPEDWQSARPRQVDPPKESKGKPPDWANDPDRPGRGRKRDVCDGVPRRERPSGPPPEEAPPLPDGPRMMILNGEPVLVDAAGRVIGEQDDFVIPIDKEF